jgi:hypothetical protein
MKNWLQAKDNHNPVMQAGKASIKQYGELYKKLDAYDKGDLPEGEALSESRDLRRIIRSS